MTDFQEHPRRRGRSLPGATGPVARGIEVDVERPIHRANDEAVVGRPGTAELCCFESPQIGCPVARTDDGRGIAVDHQQTIHEQPRGTAIAVDEGMYAHEPEMRLRGEVHRVEGGSGLEPIGKIPHQIWHPSRIRHDDGRAGDPYRHGAIGAGAGVIDAFEHQFVQAKDFLLGNDALTADEFGDEIERPRMVGRLEMFLEALAADGYSLFQNNGSLSAGERVAFQRIARVGQLDPKPRFEIAERLGRQGPQAVECLFFGVNRIESHA